MRRIRVCGALGRQVARLGAQPPRDEVELQRRAVGPQRARSEPPMFTKVTRTVSPWIPANIAATPLIAPVGGCERLDIR